MNEEGKARVLVGADAASYGGDFNQHVLAQYRVYVEAADRLSARRGAANTFLLGANALLVSLHGVIASIADAAFWPAGIAGAGIAMCVAWASLIQSYRSLARAKFLGLCQRVCG